MMAMYLFWLEKPLGVEYPVTVLDMRTPEGTGKGSPKPTGGAPDERGDHPIQQSPTTPEGGLEVGSGDLKEAPPKATEREIEADMEDLKRKPATPTGRDLEAGTGDSRGGQGYFRDVLKLDCTLAWIMTFDEVLHYGVKPSHSVIGRCVVLAAYTAAWKSHFPTPVESILWKISALVLPVTPAIHYLLDPKDVYYRVFEECWKSEVKGKAISDLGIPTLGFLRTWRTHKMKHLNQQKKDTTLRFCLDMFIVFILFSIYICHLFTRGFLMIEAFISVRNLPAGSYNTVAWGNYWPHF